MRFSVISIDCKKQRRTSEAHFLLLFFWISKRFYRMENYNNRIFYSHPFFSSPFLCSFHGKLTLHFISAIMGNGWKGSEHRSRNNDLMQPSTEVQRDADSLTENEITNGASPSPFTSTSIQWNFAKTTTTTSTPFETFIRLLHLNTSSASLTANLILNILLIYTYTVFM